MSRITSTNNSLYISPMYSATPQSARIQEAGQGLSCKSLQRGTSLTVTCSDRYLNQKCIMEVHIVTSYTQWSQILLLICSQTPTSCEPEERMGGSNNTRTYPRWYFKTSCYPCTTSTFCLYMYRVPSSTSSYVCTDLIY